jgi:hypothetical protein
MDITTEELKQLQLLDIKYKELIVLIGENELNLIKFKKEKFKLTQSFEEIQDEDKTLKEYLIKKYGDNKQIDLKTGEIING